MENKKLAKILYGMSLGLDYADGIEYAEEEIECISEELERIGDSLRNVLETIAFSNEDMEKFVDNLMKGNNNIKPINEKELIIEIVNYVISRGTQNTTNGSWIIYSDELQDMFNVSYLWLLENAEDIKEEIDSREEILTETWDEFNEDGKWDGFSCNFCGKYCPNWEEAGEFE